MRAPMISYAPNGEDVVLSRALGSVPGFYVEVGGGSPTEDSVTRHFYEHGWRGIDVEPVREFAAAIMATRPRDCVVEAAAGPEQGRTLLYRVRGDLSASTVVPDVAERLVLAGTEVEQVVVDLSTLDAILEREQPPFIDFLRIDAPGAERDVLSGLDLRRWRPRVILVTDEMPSSLASRAPWEALLEDENYLTAGTDGGSRYYVRREDEFLVPLLVPANASDAFVRAADEALRRENERLRAALDELQTELARSSTAVAQREGRDRAVGIESARLQSTATIEEVHELDRIAVITSPESGSAHLANLLGYEFGLASEHAAHPADVAWAALPDRALLELEWGYSDRLRALLLGRGFRVVTVARDPLDVLVALLGHAQLGTSLGPLASKLRGVEPASDEFVRFASSQPADELVAISVDWWQEPSAIRLRYEELLGGGEALVDRLRSALDIPGGPRRATALSHEIAGEGLSASGIWRRVLDRERAAVLIDHHRNAFSRLGLEVPATDGVSSTERASDGWHRLLERCRTASTR